MTGHTNNSAANKFFNENNFFGYPSNSINFFTQDKLPIVDTDGKILLSEPYVIKEDSNRKW